MRTFTCLFFAFLIFATLDLQAQFKLKDLKKKVERKVEERAERKVDRTIDKGLDEAEGEIDETTRGGKKSDSKDGEEETPDSQSQPQDGTISDSEVDEVPNSNDNHIKSNNTEGTSTTSSDFKINTKFDFVPGQAVLVVDDFSEDALGDFPAKWNTNGTGEIVTLSGLEGKWFQLKSGSEYLPDIPGGLPESYTIEFDMRTKGIDKKTSSNARFNILLDEDNKFNKSNGYRTHDAEIQIPLGQYSAFGIIVQNYKGGNREIRNQVQADVREAILGTTHISIAVNKTRLRLWVNEKKYIDVPRLIPLGKTKYLNLEPAYLEDGKEDIFIGNFKVAEGGLDLRGQLLKEGKVSTSGIMFNVNSDQVKPESYGVIRQIALAMQEDTGMRIKMVGHTDSDGAEESNLSLSKQRAASVLKILSNDFDVDADRMESDGKGEGEPLDENDTLEGKANNRRVEFIKL